MHFKSQLSFLPLSCYSPDLYLSLVESIPSPDYDINQTFSLLKSIGTSNRGPDREYKHPLFTSGE